MKNTYFAMKTNGIRWCSSKKKWIFPLRLIFYVCSSARNWVSSMYKGIDQFPLGSSDPGCLKFLNWRTFQEKRSPEMINFFLYCSKKMSFSSSPKVTPTTGVVELWLKNKNAMKTNGIRLYSTKNGWTFPWFSWSFTVGVKKYSFWCPRND